MRFIRTLFLVILLEFVGLAVQYLHYAGSLDVPRPLGRSAFAASALLGLLWLFLAALRARRSRAANFDMIVAAESLIAFGILSLLLGLGLGILILATDPGRAELAATRLDIPELEPLLLPVAEGLVATAVATILANLLRQIEVVRYGTETTAAALPQATTPEELGQRLANLSSRLEVATQHLERLALAFRKGAEDYAAAMERLTAATTGVGARVEAEGEALRRALEQAGRHAQAFASELGAAGAAGSEAMRELAAESRRFRDAAREGTTLLDGLARLIASVERFIRPERERP
jgi:hypothetical protein